MEDDHKDSSTAQKLKHPSLNKISHKLKRDLNRKQNIKFWLGCSWPTALPTSSEFSKYSGQGNKKNLKWMLEDGPYKYGS